MEKQSLQNQTNTFDNFFKEKNDKKGQNDEGFLIIMIEMLYYLSFRRDHS